MKNYSKPQNFVEIRSIKDIKITSFQMKINKYAVFCLDGSTMRCLLKHNNVSLIAKKFMTTSRQRIQVKMKISVEKSEKPLKPKCTL